MSGFGGFSFGKPGTGAATTTTASGNFAFSTGVAPATTPAGGFNFGTPTGQKTASGLPLTTPATYATTNTGFGPPAATTSSGFSLGQPAGTGFSLGGSTATTSAGSSLFGAATTASGTPSFGFAKPIPVSSQPTTTTTSSGFGFGTGLKLGTASTTSAPTLGGGLGGFGLTTSVGAIASGGGSIFGQAIAKTTSSGLGGVDPKTTTSTASSTTGKPGDSKTVKESQVENNILLDVDELRKYVKEEKSEMEQMKRMSSTPMIKVQEDNAALKQLLSVVSSGLQKNSCAVDKLKREMTQELKNAEMAIRTKETPPGLQYENTAPTLYFQILIENFESQMLTYRQQIEMLENHLSSVHQPNRLTPEELVLLLRKLHEAFVAMAAQLQQIHEAVKTQKEHYLNYRKVFHGDSRNIFERQRKAPVKVSAKSHADLYGQPPFPGVNNAAAVAMATALTRTQQPQPAAGAPPVTGFSNFQSSSGFGAPPTGFGAFGSSTAQNSTFKGFGSGTSTLGAGTSGFGTGSSLFGNTSNLATTQAGSLFSSTLPGANSQLNLSTATEQPFQLNKPPVGSKRGKR